MYIAIEGCPLEELTAYLCLTSGGEQEKPKGPGFNPFDFRGIIRIKFQVICFTVQKKNNKIG